jgi:uncharacterized protein YcfJ
MLKHLVCAAVIALSATAASADAYVVESNSVPTGLIVEVEPVFVYSSIPQTQEQCVQVQVPVYGGYGYNQPYAGNAIAGAIIGGAIGNQFGNGQGNDVATVLGAIIGANTALRPRQQVGIVGYNTEVECRLVTTNVQNQTITHYRVTYEYNGNYHTISTRNPLLVGQRILIQ